MRRMLTLYTTRRTPDGFYSYSPFCAKLEAWLGLSGVEYTRRGADPRKSPTGKIPYADLDGELIADSQRIIDRIIARDGDRLDADLDPTQRATGRMVRRTLEEATYFAVVRARWLTPDGFAFVREQILDPFVPRLLRPLVYPKIQRDLRKVMHNQGIGRYPLDEVHRMAIADFAALEGLLADRPFVLGDRPTSVDATAYGWVGCVASSTYRDPTIDYVQGSKTLTAYRERMAARLEDTSASS